MDLKEACTLICKAMFKNLPHTVSVDIGGEPHRIRRSKTTGLRYVLITINGQQYRIMEQNRRKRSKWATMAKNGSKILWIFDDEGYHARYVDGDLTIL